jgi:hypothetical protein
MADGHLSNANLSELEWLSLILSDINRVRTALLRAEYSHHRSQITDETARIALEQQYYKLKCSVTPICRLPVEILSKIFYISIEIGHPRTRLMHVCQNWRRIIEGMSGAWTSLRLQARTAPESVQQSLHRAQMHPLVVEIDIGKTKGTVEILYSILAAAAKSASRWETLTIISLPESEKDVPQVDSLHCLDFPPMNQLKHLRVIQSASSPLLNWLLQNIGTFAVGCLASMEIHSSPAILLLIQLGHAPIFGSITTFKAQLPKMSRLVDLLPHFNQLEELELTNVSLPIYAPQTLAFVHTLRQLYLRAVSIQWMGGQVFPNLERCTILSPPRRTHPLLLNVSLPVCTTFEIRSNDIVPIRRFSVPNVCSLVIQSNKWSAMRGDEQIVHLFRAVLETSLRPNALCLSITCQSRLLLALLRQLPGLHELRLDLPRSSALGKRFFTQLLAKPLGETHWTQLRKLRSSKEWKSMICPSLGVLELRYQQWLRQSDCLDFLTPLFAMSQSRERTGMQLKLGLHFRSSQNTWRSFELTPQSTIPISTLEIPGFMHSDQSTPIGLPENCFTGASLDLIETQNYKCTIYEILVLPFCFNHLQVLQLGAKQTQQLNVLHLFQQLKELRLQNIHIPFLTPGADLPLVHTLRRLHLESSSLAWMDGQVFSRLLVFFVDEYGWPESFKHKVQMPACTYIKFIQDDLRVLPLLHSSIYLPLLNTWELGTEMGNVIYDQNGFSALKTIQVKYFELRIAAFFPRLRGLLEAKDEVEHLVLRISAHFYPRNISTMLVPVHSLKANTMRTPCSNMRVLNLLFEFLGGYNRDNVSRWCMRMMDSRGLAGYPIEKIVFPLFDLLARPRLPNDHAASYRSAGTPSLAKPSHGPGYPSSFPNRHALSPTQPSADEKTLAPRSNHTAR